MDKLSVELKVELGDGIGDTGILCLFLGSGDGVSSEPRCRFMLSGYGVKGIFLGECNGDEVGETDSHGEDGWGFLSLFCTLGLLSGSGDGVKLITRGLFLMVTDGTNGDGVCGEDADDCDVHGEGG